jgi:hypothetical protein
MDAHPKVSVGPGILSLAGLHLRVYHDFSVCQGSLDSELIPYQSNSISTRSRQGTTTAVQRTLEEVNSPIAGAPELRPGALSAELDPEDGAFTPPSGGGAPAPLHPQGQTPPQGARLLPVVNPEGVITGFGFGEGSAKDQPLAETMLALRRQSYSPLPSAGRPALRPYVADTGFEGKVRHCRWRLLYGADVICHLESSSHKAWPKAWRRWLHRIRQMVETVYAKLMDFFRLDKERPHTLDGFQANLAAKMALHNFCIWLNKQLGRESLAFADLLGW